jgi:hypothetical protein
MRGVDECWPWIGKTKATNGYGRMDVMNVLGAYAHRVAYLAANPDSISLRAPKHKNLPEFVLHTCDNPACCNPKHLFLGTYADNTRDRRVKGRAPNFSGERGPNSKLTQAEADEIRRLTSYGISTGALASLFGISKSGVKGITSGRHFAVHHV